MHNTCVVDQDINTAKRLDRGISQSNHTRLITHVYLHSNRLMAIGFKLSLHRHGSFQLDISDHHLDACPPESDAKRFANTVSSTRYNGRFIIQIHRKPQSNMWVAHAPKIAAVTVYQ